MHEYAFFAPTTLTTDETLNVISRVGHAVSQQTRSKIRYDRQQNRIEIESQSAAGLADAKRLLKDALFTPTAESVEDKRLATMRKRQWNKDDKNEFWSNPDEHVRRFIMRA